MRSHLVCRLANRVTICLFNWALILACGGTYGFSWDCDPGNLIPGYLCKLNRRHERIDYGINWAFRKASVEPLTLIWRQRVSN
jgi:hypothetical protein